MLGLKVTEIGDDVRYECNLQIFGGGNIYLGNHLNLQDAFINAVQAKNVIGDFTFFGHGVMLVTGRHNYNKIGAKRQNPISGNPIHIGNGVRVG